MNASKEQNMTLCFSVFPRNKKIHLDFSMEQLKAKGEFNNIERREDCILLKQYAATGGEVNKRVQFSTAEKGASC